jgi:hypothetical protein
VLAPRKTRDRQIDVELVPIDQFPPQSDVFICQQVSTVTLLKSGSQNASDPPLPVSAPL